MNDTGRERGRGEVDWLAPLDTGSASPAEAWRGLPESRAKCFHRGYPYGVILGYSDSVRRIPTYCRSWMCPACAGYRAGRELRHWTRLFEQIGHDRFFVLVVGFSAKEDRDRKAESVGKAARRKGANRWMVKRDLPQPCLCVVSDHDLGGRSVESRSLSLERLVDLLPQMLAVPGLSRKPDLNKIGSWAIASDQLKAEQRSRSSPEALGWTNRAGFEVRAEGLAEKQDPESGGPIASWTPGNDSVSREFGVSSDAWSREIDRAFRGGLLERHLDRSGPADD